MKKAANYELSFHSSMYIHINLSTLHLPEVPLTIPTLNDAILINSPELHEPKRLLVESVKPGSELVISRPDGIPLQVVEADDRRETYAHDLFHDPIPQLGLRCLDLCTWAADVDEVNVKDAGMFREFVGILSVFATNKQVRLKDS